MDVSRRRRAIRTSNAQFVNDKANIENPACPAQPLQDYTGGGALSIVRRAASRRRCNQNGHCVEIGGLLRSARAPRCPRE
jgi:hypothetical protein